VIYSPISFFLFNFVPRKRLAMAEMQEDIEKWYVLGCLSVHHEEKVRDALRKAGFRSHVPMKYEVKHVRRQEQRTMVPAI
jgi:hypothetical protein